MVVDYIQGLVMDEDEEADDIVTMTRSMLQGGPSTGNDDSLNRLCVLSDTDFASDLMIAAFLA